MTDKVFVNADRTRIVPAGSVDAAMQIHRSEAKKLGLVESEEAPKQTRRTTPQKRRKRKSE